jgi:RNase adaptor protein for sRNA GlmZ degradation
MSESSEDKDEFSGLDQLVLITGVSGEGKSRSLYNIRDQHDWIYLNVEAGL